mmetsp:Transcript_18451/g.37442  ORF Transcript_18451/g.37442 Transcript_18451/m.37442 type:complete len:277 (+) Transcript_18451:463-1293(+)
MAAVRHVHKQIPLRLLVDRVDPAGRLDVASFLLARNVPRSAELGTLLSLHGGQQRGRPLLEPLAARGVSKPHGVELGEAALLERCCLDHAPHEVLVLLEPVRPLLLVDREQVVCVLHHRLRDLVHDRCARGDEGVRGLRVLHARVDLLSDLEHLVDERGNEDRLPLGLQFLARLVLEAHVGSEGDHHHSLPREQVQTRQAQHLEKRHRRKQDLLLTWVLGQAHNVRPLVDDPEVQLKHCWIAPSRGILCGNLEVQRRRHHPQFSPPLAAKKPFEQP